MKKIISVILCLLVLLNPFIHTANATSETNDVTTEEEDIPVIFTEVYPNDKSNSHIAGAGNNDLFEFVEIFNTTDDDINFNSLYKVRYDYLTNSKDLAVTAVDDKTNIKAIIPRNSSAVLWIERTSTKITGTAAKVTEEDFREYHQIRAEVPVFKLRGQDGLANTNRGFYITQKENKDNIISHVHWTSEEVGDGLSYHTKIPHSGTTMDSFENKGEPTPGVVKGEQLEFSSNTEPIIIHSPVNSIQTGTDLTINFIVDDADHNSLEVNLYYRMNPYSEFREVTIEPKQSSEYSYTIPADSIPSDVIHYYIEASDGITQVKSDTFEIGVVDHEKGNTAPPILITEMTPNPAGDFRKGAGNQYEFVEIYNNSDEVLNLKGYTLFYLYPNNSAAPKKWTISEETAIEPYKTGIIWFAKEAVRDGFTKVEDFNIHYNSSVSNNHIVSYDNKNSVDFNLPNTTKRGFAISSSDSLDDMIVEAWYDASGIDSQDRMLDDVKNSAVLFRFPESGKSMERTATRPYSTPGSIDKGQVPEVTGQDLVAPLIDHSQPFYQMQSGTNKKITITSNEKLTKATLVFGRGENPLTDFINHVDMTLKEHAEGRYIYEANLKITDVGVYRYMVHTEDASGNITKVPYNSRGNQITVIEEALEIEIPNVGLSLTDGDMISGKVKLYAYGEKASDDMMITLNGKELETKQALPGKVQFGFQGRGIDYIYQVSASAKTPAAKREYFTRILPSYVDGAWYTYDMSPDYFISDSIVSIHSGGENVAYDLDVHDEQFNKTNFDDFEVINIHLVLPDGTTIKPETVRNYLGNLQQIVVPYHENVFHILGDGGAPAHTNFTRPMKREFYFNIPDEKFTAAYSEIDTTEWADGKYQLKLDWNSAQADVAEITIDNTKPVIKGIAYHNGKLINEGMQLKGNLAFTLEAEDNLTGISKIEATLNGESISFPYKTSSAQLADGNHDLDVNVYDGAGNMSSHSVTFTIETEKPEYPFGVSPADFSQVGSKDVPIEAKVTDPSGDLMDITFYQGKKYDFASGDGIEGFSHIADREPPLTIQSVGENGMSETDFAKIAHEDGQYLVNDSTEGFPYHRFEVTVEEELTTGDKVVLYWKGKTFPKRKVTLYAWDHTADKWVALKAVTGDSSETDIVLSAEVDKEKFIKAGKIQAMVQDEVKTANDPFTILWATDTQYYAESYPHIWDGLGDWIRDEYKNGNFEYMIHSGDLVNVADSDAQWMVADRNLQKLDDIDVPYGVLAGNHDSIIDGIDYSYYHKWVGEHRYKNNPWYGGSMDNNRNHYDLMSFGGHDFIILYLGFGLEDTPESIEWANEALQKHSDRNAILVMHAYLEYGATLSKMSQNVYDQIIVPNENVKMVMGGHYHGVATRVSEIPNEDGSTRKVLEMLADYQEGPNGGDGYVRYLTFNPVNETVDVVTYSPILDDYNFFDEEGVDTFTSEYQLNDMNKRVATDYFSVNIYSNQLIGKNEDVVSGEIARTEWKDLEPYETYYWYMNITDKYGGTRTSNIYRFITTKGTKPTIAEPGNTGNAPGDNTEEKQPAQGNQEEAEPVQGNPKEDKAGQRKTVQEKSEQEILLQEKPEIAKANGATMNTTNNEFLPQTATNMFNWIAAGCLFMLVGSGLVFVRRVKRKNA
ncbi:metallophosphoesterase [Litchfieldia alkalitelluris]|uniref:metallophosphoesterase n=1 Tax=Litchfieldia alkalitelluris TaxID=304268 RepID=UPI00147324CF|nr:metallophosphoesterase [Litchfieldia alkalitelluris]